MNVHSNPAYGRNSVASYHFRRVRSHDGKYSYEVFPAGLARAIGVNVADLLSQKQVEFEWLHPDDRAQFVNQLEFSARTMTPLDNTFRIVGEDGRTRWGRGVSRPSARPDRSVVWEGLGTPVSLSGNIGQKSDVEDALECAREHISSLAYAVDPGIAGSSVREDLIRLALHLDRLVWHLPPSAAGVRQQLTGRQHEIAELIAAGYSNKLIARTLDITPGTVKVHVASIFKKIDAKSRRDVVRYWRALQPSER